MLKIIGNKSYEYRSVRVDGRPVKKYVGPGPSADVAEMILAATRAEAEEERAEFRAMVARDGEVDGEAERLAEGAFLAAEALLLAAGMHRPSRGPWRRRRCPARR